MPPYCIEKGIVVRSVLFVFYAILCDNIATGSKVCYDDASIFMNQLTTR